ncbi:antibiotic biosynthesis monooxygenase [Sutcliffiella cohnii]|uniref:Antibiotic biosynthesis monooxygenase n=1 Tax=Sutcliffiella cohnii TaxID=33932 RepID=A0A223KL45_9BACI|nr:MULTISPECIES: antibiotic biosynthesis monooxygenase [Sutcliffiella]AST90229.1 antibiotic biosynthesis monooxygenase [Sutcliffiella cohnii]WBL15883.1 antibiotic biosynthesis monooxygenase [Sutcliffiella sp. NC1]
MFIQLRKTVVTEGNADKVIERFSKPGIIEQQEGFIDSTVMVKKVRRGDEEVIVQIRWESEEHWKQWEKSDAHIAGHKAKLGQPKPDYIVHSEGGVYNVVSVKKPL